MNSRYKELKVDKKWSVVYDVEDNCRPVLLLCRGRGHPHNPALWSNSQVAMFYRLLEIEEMKDGLINIQSEDPSRKEG